MNHRMEEDGTIWMKFHDDNGNQTMWIQNLVRTSNEKDDKIDKLASENFELKKRLAVRVDLEVQAAAVAHITSLATTERLLVALREAVAKMAETKEQNQ